MKAIVRSVAVLVLIGVVGRAQAGFVTATLSANPNAINEGGSTALTLSVFDSPFTNGGYEFFNLGLFNSGFYYVGYFGDGYISSIGGDLFSGDGRTTIPISANPNSTSFTATDTVTYLTPGTFTASVTGTVSMVDYFADGPFGTFPSFSNAGLFASTQIHVANVDPEITKINWTPIVTVGQDFSFSVNAYDPGLAGGETLTYAYDLSGTSAYTDLVATSGGSDSETYHFATPGIHTVGIKVTDSNGGVTFGSFNVEADPAAPEPTSLAVFGTMALGFVGWRRWPPRNRTATSHAG